MQVRRRTQPSATNRPRGLAILPSPECGGSGPFPPPSGFRRRSVPPAGTIRQSIGAGGHGAEAIPVPIPNTEVKLRSADDTGSVPGKQVAAGFFFAHDTD